MRKIYTHKDLVLVQKDKDSCFKGQIKLPNNIVVQCILEESKTINSENRFEVAAWHQSTNEIIFLSEMGFIINVSNDELDFILFELLKNNFGGEEYYSYLCMNEKGIHI